MEGSNRKDRRAKRIMIYKDKDWLEDQYINQKKSTVEIAKLCVVSDETIRKWLKKLDIQIRSPSESQKISQNKLETKKKKSNSMKGKIFSEEHKRKISESKKEEENPAWKGNWEDLGCGQKHIRMKKLKLKPDKCEICGESGKLELSNVDHKYKRCIEDYRWLCRSCHLKYDIKKGFRKTRWNKSVEQISRKLYNKGEIKKR